MFTFKVKILSLRCNQHFSKAQLLLWRQRDTLFYLCHSFHSFTTVQRVVGECLQTIRHLSCKLLRKSTSDQINCEHSLNNPGKGIPESLFQLISRRFFVQHQNLFVTNFTLSVLATIRQYTVFPSDQRLQVHSYY